MGDLSVPNHVVELASLRYQSGRARLSAGWAQRQAGNVFRLSNSGMAGMDRSPAHR